MAILDFLIGNDDLKEQKKAADKVTRATFDSSAFNPLYADARQTAMEGIDDDSIRTQGIKQIYTSTQTPIASVGQGSGLASLQQSDANRSSALADMEGKIGIAEESAKKEGRQNAAQIMSKMREVDQKRIAGLEQNRLDMLAEEKRRKKALGTTAGRLLGTVAGTAIPGIGTIGATAIGAGGGALFGGTEGALAGASAGLASSIEQQSLEDLQAENEKLMNRNNITDLFMQEYITGQPMAYNYGNPTMG